eukprot:scaffold102559_cov57-Phaeocystis_antarctica.AAC.2
MASVLGSQRGEPLPNTLCQVNNSSRATRRREPHRRIDGRRGFGALVIAGVLPVGGAYTGAFGCAIALEGRVRQPAPEPVALARCPVFSSSVHLSDTSLHLCASGANPHPSQVSWTHASPPAHLMPGCTHTHAAPLRRRPAH